MPTASIALVETSYRTGGTRIEIVPSESLSALTTSAIETHGNSETLTYRHQSGDNYVFDFSTAHNQGDPGYIRIFVPRTATTPNLDADIDHTIYWGTDNVLHHGATDDVRESRLHSTLTNVRWRVPTSYGGQTVGIELTFDIDTDVDLVDLTVAGDITTLVNFGRYITYQTYRADVALPASLAGGGSFTIQIRDLESVYPGLGESEEWTLSWDADGTLSAIRTSQIPVAITASLNVDYVAVGEELILTLDYDKDGAAVPVSDISVIDGMTVVAQPSPNNRQHRYRLTAPATGKGTAVVSIPVNVIEPGNNAVSIQFTYIDSVTPTLELTATGIENAGTVIAEVGFDYDVPIFRSDFLESGGGYDVFAIGNDVLAFGDAVLGVESENNATFGEALPLDDRNRLWAVPVTVPETGEGELEIMLPEDAIGALSHEAVMAPLFYAAQRAPSIQRRIGVRDNFVVLPVFGEVLDFQITITGNGPITVRVTGELRPFYQDWDRTKGILHIRGRPMSYFEDLKFTVTATDQDGTSSVTGAITVIDKPPEIKPPAVLQFAKGLMNSVIIPIDNFPREASAEGDWLNLNHEVVPARGVRVFGDIPGDANMPNTGDILVKATNRGNPDNPVMAMVRWEFTSPTRPAWRRIKNFSFDRDVLAGFNNNRLFIPLNYDFSIDMNQFVSGIPVPEITQETEIRGNQGQFSVSELGIGAGRFTANFDGRTEFLAKNSLGSQNVSNVRIYAHSNYVAPRYTGPNTIPDVVINSRPSGSRRFVVGNIMRFSGFFNVGFGGSPSSYPSALMNNCSYFQLLNVNNDVLYHEDDSQFLDSYDGTGSTQVRRTASMIQVHRHAAFGSLIQIQAFNVSAQVFAQIRGRYSDVKVRMTNLLGTAETPPFDLVIQ